MKSNIIRAFVLTLTLAGIGASAVTSAHASRAKVSDKELPPMCAPSDPTYCGMH